MNIDFMKNKKMKILYISTVFPKKDSTIYTDLAEELVSNGHEVTVVVSNGKSKETELSVERSCKVLRVKTGDIYNVSYIKKGISILTLNFFLKKAIKKFLKNESYDFILFESPPITLYKTVSFLKKIYKIKSFLMLKDIFPQNAVDMEIIKKNSLIYKIFRYKEKKLYKIADYIGCMSKGNLEYIFKHNKLDTNKLLIFPNTKKIKFMKEFKNNEIKRKYGLPENKVIFIFGGNMGKPQGLNFLANSIKELNNYDKAFFLLIGRGSEKDRIKEILLNNNNYKILENIPRNDYEKIVKCCDVGIISLDNRFTIPNYPSRILSYMEASIPVLCATDKNTDFKELIKKSKCGLWCESKDITQFILNIKRLCEDDQLRKSMGKSGRKYLIKYFDIRYSVKILERVFVK